MLTRAEVNKIKKGLMLDINSNYKKAFLIKEEFIRVKEVIPRALNHIIVCTLSIYFNSLEDLIWFEEFREEMFIMFT